MSSDRRVESLHPYFQPIVKEALRRSWARGVFPFIIEGKRSPEYQACLYARGRTPAGQTFVMDRLVVQTRFTDKSQRAVVATCGAESYTVAASEWKKIVTKVGPYGSWHTLGFAIDLSFRSARDVSDHLIGDLERRAATLRAEGKTHLAAAIDEDIARRYARMHEIFREVAPGVRWGNDWNQNGVPTRNDKAEGSFVDLPHWEWHPGVTIGDVRAGRLPAFPEQCLGCLSFPASRIGKVCLPCFDKAKEATRAV